MAQKTVNCLLRVKSIHVCHYTPVRNFAKRKPVITALPVKLSSKFVIKLSLELHDILNVYALQRESCDTISYIQWLMTQLFCVTLYR